MLAMTWDGPPPLAVLNHQSRVYGPPSRRAEFRQVPKLGTGHAYLFNQQGLAVARIEGKEFARVVFGGNLDDN